ncbi:MFS transporter [Neomoorella carbonis]|uniref:MFS transporter n=1 Tax=Neomoorella carbonis TaxID=3062783 RepID=UPI00324B8554
MKQTKIFYGWWIVLVAFLSIAITYGTKGVFGIVQLAMLEDLHWNRATIAGALSANMLVYAIAAPMVGRLMDKVGVKNTLIIGSLLTGLAYILVTTINSPLQFYIYYGILLGLAGTGMGMIPGPTAVSRWFIKKRGRALSLAIVGSPLGTAIFTFLAKDWLNTMGWKGTFKIMAILSWVLVIIPTFFLMRTSPEEMGMLPDGETSPVTTSGTAKKNIVTVYDNEEEWSLSKLLTSPKAWGLFLAYFFMAGNGWMQQVHQVPHLILLGLNKDVATNVLGINMFLAVISMLIWPSISDFMQRRTALIISLILQIVGSLLLLNARTLTLTYLFVVVMGLSYMGCYGLFSAMAADLFGRRSLGTVNGIMATAGAAGAAFGIYFGGWIYDITHSYSLLWEIGIIGLVIAIGLAVAMGRKAGQQTSLQA